jgi:O-acetylserine/cysteine efflux transporter
MIGLTLTLMAAFSWAIGNIAIKQAKNVNMLSLVAWGALVPILPFLLCSLLFEGSDLIMLSIKNASGGGIAAVLYQSYAATLIGYVLWGRLLSQHPIGLVAPLTLLVPVIGLISAAILLNEHLSTMQWFGAAIVMFALIVNVFGRRFR